MTAPEPTPRTAAGRALLGAIQGEPKPSTRLSMILAIEAEAAALAGLREALHAIWIMAGGGQDDDHDQVAVLADIEEQARAALTTPSSPAYFAVDATHWYCFRAKDHDGEHADYRHPDAAARVTHCHALFEKPKDALATPPTPEPTPLREALKEAIAWVTAYDDAMGHGYCATQSGEFGESCTCGYDAMMDRWRAALAAQPAALQDERSKHLAFAHPGCSWCAAVRDDLEWQAAAYQQEGEQ